MDRYEFADKIKELLGIEALTLYQRVDLQSLYEELIESASDESELRNLSEDLEELASDVRSACDDLDSAILERDWNAVDDVRLALDMAAIR